MVSIVNNKNLHYIFQELKKLEEEVAPIHIDLIRNVVGQVWFPGISLIFIFCFVLF